MSSLWVTTMTMRLVVVTGADAMADGRCYGLMIDVDDI